MKKTHLLLTAVALVGASIALPAQASQMKKIAENVGIYMSMITVASDHCSSSNFDPGVQKRARHLNGEAAELYNALKGSPNTPAELNSMIQQVYNDAYSNFKKKAKSGNLDKVCQPGQFADVETMLSVIRKPIEQFVSTSN